MGNKHATYPLKAKKMPPCFLRWLRFAFRFRFFRQCRLTVAQERAPQADALATLQVFPAGAATHAQLFGFRQQARLLQAVCGFGGFFEMITGPLKWG